MQTNHLESIHHYHPTSLKTKTRNSWNSFYLLWHPCSCLTSLHTNQTSLIFLRSHHSYLIYLNLRSFHFLLANLHHPMPTEMRPIRLHLLYPWTWESSTRCIQVFFDDEKHPICHSYPSSCLIFHCRIHHSCCFCSFRTSGQTNVFHLVMTSYLVMTNLEVTTYRYYEEFSWRDDSSLVHSNATEYSRDQDRRQRVNLSKHTIANYV